MVHNYVTHKKKVKGFIPVAENSLKLFVSMHIYVHCPEMGH